MRKKIFSYLPVLLGLPVVILTGTLVFRDKQYAWVTLCATLLACVPFFLSFERRRSSAKELLVLAVMVSLAVVGRILFLPLPGFKPVTAIIVITALYFGPEMGFMTGALTAVISNFYFGQGPWTPFQLFVWGLIGFLAGVLARPLKKSRLLLAAYGVFSGVLFSLLMDVWLVLWADGQFVFSRFTAAITAALGFTAIYAVSNVVFLLLFSGVLGRKLERIQYKYRI